MKKIYNKGFMLIETLIVTTFVAGVLVFLLIQFMTLSENYNNSYKYNTVENIYAVRNIYDYIVTDTSALNSIKESVDKDGYLDISNCSLFKESDYCLKLLELENVKKIYITNNYMNKDLFYNHNDGLKTFINKINYEGNEKYRILVEFNNSKYATIRFGE